MIDTRIHLAQLIRQIDLILIKRGTLFYCPSLLGPQSWAQLAYF